MSFSAGQGRIGLTELFSEDAINAALARLDELASPATPDEQPLSTGLVPRAPRGASPNSSFMTRAERHITPGDGPGQYHPRTSSAVDRS